jgi:ATP-dependent DNA helicase RecG
MDLLGRSESHFFDCKSMRAKGATIEKIAAAFSNAEGGEFVVGIEDGRVGTELEDRWVGFADEEGANHIFQALVQNVSPPIPYVGEWLECAGLSELGLVCRVHVRKSPDVHHTSTGRVYVRRNAQNLELTGAAITDLALSKGSRSYEDQLLDGYGFERLAAEAALLDFLDEYSPRTEPLDYAMTQELVDNDGRVTVGGAVLYADNPSAVVPRRCGIKISRYATTETGLSRDHLVGVPVSVEGPLNSAIHRALDEVQAMLDGQTILDSTGELVPMRYPPDALKEVIVNAAIHRDLNVSDDVQIRVYDNRVEVESPGRLPGHVTIENLGSTRFGRNPTIVRLLNKYPDPLNKDIGDGIPTVLRRMKQAKLSEPSFQVLDASFLVTLKHTPLARPHEIVLRYLAAGNAEVTNSIARGLTGITSENSMKDVFISLKKAGHLEPVPDKRGAKSAWQLTAAGAKEAAKLTA